MDIPLSCACGALQIVVHDLAPKKCSRVICHCKGCRAWASRIEPELLDENGGTERIIVNPATVKVQLGAQHLGCTSQTRAGAYRWFATCCNSSLGLSTNNLHMPFLALDVRRVQAGTKGLFDAVGPLRARVNCNFAQEARREMQADWRSLAWMLLELVPLFAGWWRRDAQRKSPFVDGKTLQPTTFVNHLEQPRTRDSTACGCG